MAEDKKIKIDSLPSAVAVSTTDVLPLVQGLEGSRSTRAATVGMLGDNIAADRNYADLQTTSKNLIGAINEVKGDVGASALADLTDVNISSPTDGQVIKYDSDSDKWVNADDEGGGTAAEISFDNTGTDLNATDVQGAVVEVNSRITSLPSPMVYKGQLGVGGAISNLPTDGSADVGDTYKVITAGTYAGVVADIGDAFICLTKTSSANTWDHFPSGDEPDALSALTDVVISSISDGQILKYNSQIGKWVNANSGGTAADITYNNSTSGLSSVNVQGAVDELASTLNTLRGLGLSYTYVNIQSAEIISQSNLPIETVGG